MQERSRDRSLGWVALLAVGLLGCGGASYAYDSRASGGGGGGGAATASEPASPPSKDYAWSPPSLGAAGGAPAAPAPAPVGGDEQAPVAPSAGADRAESVSMDDSGPSTPQGLLSGTMTGAQQPQQKLAQNQPQGGGAEEATPPAGGEAPEQPPEEEATDAVDTSGPLLIYTADLRMAVFQVEQTQEKIIDVAEGVDGYLQQRSDQVVVVRVPARKFHETVEKIEELGDVIARNIQAADVSEQFRDISIRLRNAEAMRERLEKLLDQAETVEAALKIEREMQRITELIETLKGRLRFLSDRISFSTITVRFKPRPTENVDHPDTFRLPFEWLDELGLSNLLRLR